MKNKQCTQIAAASVAGNLVESWKFLTADPRDQETLNKFANVLDADLRIKLPNGTLSGILRGYEPEIRQDAAILLLDRFLRGNNKLLKATEDRDNDRISGELERSIKAALRICRLRHHKRIVNEFGRWEELHPEDPRLPRIPAASTMHFGTLPYSIRHQLTLKLLQIAMTDPHISAKTASLAIQMLKDDLSQAEMAKKQGVSPAAISQSMKRIRKTLSRLVSEVEGPFS